MSSPTNISGQSQNESGTPRGEVVPLSRISIDTGYRDTPQPEAIRVVLDCETSEVLRDVGDTFAVIGRASYPDNPKRMVLHAIPCDIETANRAVSVAKGELLTRKKPTK